MDIVWVVSRGVVLPVSSAPTSSCQMTNTKIETLRAGAGEVRVGQFPFICFLANLWTTDKQSLKERCWSVTSVPRPGSDRNLNDRKCTVYMLNLSKQKLFISGISSIFRSSNRLVCATLPNTNTSPKDGIRCEIGNFKPLNLIERWPQCLLEYLKYIINWEIKN